MQRSQLKKSNPICKYKGCRKRFTPYYNGQVVCSIECARKWAQEQLPKEEAKKQKEKRIQNKAQKDGLKTKGEHMNELQKIFNKWVRLRDKNQPCISCGTTNPIIKYDAGHCFSVGSHPNLRIHPYNVHRQCSENCNNKKSGNQAEYLLRLPARIGDEKYNQLLLDKNKPKHYSIPEIEKLKTYYREEIKKLESSE